MRMKAAASQSGSGQTPNRVFYSGTPTLLSLTDPGSAPGGLTAAALRVAAIIKGPAISTRTSLYLETNRAEAASGLLENHFQQ